MNCPGGYYQPESDSITPTDISQCAPVGQGYYSPDKDASRRPCPPGTFSESNAAASCTECSAGSYSSQPQATTCGLCSEGTYAIESGSQECLPCNDMYYNGLASDYAIFLSAKQTGQEKGDLYCLEPIDGPVYGTPTPATVLPTSLPTKLPEGSQTFTPTRLPTSYTTLKPNTPGPTTAATATTRAPSPAPSIATTVEYIAAPTLEHSLRPSAAPQEDKIQEVYPSTGADEPNGAANRFPDFWVSALLALALALGVGLMVLWSSPSHRQETEKEDEEEPPEADARQRTTSQNSVISMFADETMGEEDGKQPYRNWRELDSATIPSGAFSGVWSLSVGLQYPHEESDSSDEFSDALSA